MSEEKYFTVCKNYDCKRELRSFEMLKLSRLSRPEQSRYRFCKKCRDSNSITHFRISCGRCGSVVQQKERISQEYCKDCSNELRKARLRNAHKRRYVSKSKYRPIRDKILELVNSGEYFSEKDIGISGLQLNRYIVILRKSGIKIDTITCYKKNGN